MKKKTKKILLIGGSGQLGTAIIKSKIFKKIIYPNKKKLNLLDKKSIKTILNKNFDLIINCAAKARMSECEKKPLEAFNINVIGTSNLVKEIQTYIKLKKKEIKLIHLSTDGVYASTKGNYSERDVTKPYNFYGQTKLLSELLVQKLSKYIIIRTRFFDKNKIRFRTAATDIFTSMIELSLLVHKIKIISNIKFNGIINIGDKRKSDYNNYRKFDKSIKPCKKKDITKNLNFKIASDASMNLNLYDKLIKKR